MDSTNTFTSKLHNLPSYYLDEASADISFDCGNDEVGRGIVTAHKYVLGSCSDYFETMFRGSLPETQNPIRFPDASPKGFETVLRYFYFNESDDYMLSLNVIDEAIYWAKKCLLDEYLNECCRFLAEQESAEGILIAFELSIKHSIPKLKRQMEIKISERHGMIFASEYFLTISFEVLQHILKSIYYCGRTKRLLNAGLEWAEEECKRLNIAPTMQNCRQLMGNFMSYFELGGMKCNELQECVQEFDGLFTTEEIQAVLFIIRTRRTQPYKEIEMVKCTIGSRSSTELKHMEKDTTKELRFIPRKKILLGLIGISNLFVEDINKTKTISILVKVVKVVKIDDDIKNDPNEVVLISEFITIPKTTAKTQSPTVVKRARLKFKDGIILEPNAVYVIRTMMVNDCWYYGCELTDTKQSYINICNGTTSDLIFNLHLVKL